MAHLTMAELMPHLEHLRAAPSDHGVLRLIARRPETLSREVVDEAVLDTEKGLLGDNWLARGSRHTPDGAAERDKQITVMSHRMISVLAADPDERALAGDQLYVDLDLSHDNLPVGTRLRIGDAVLEVTAPPHRGCAKFVRRYGVEAMRFVNGPDGRPLRLRGLNTRIVVGGSVRTGDPVSKDGPPVSPQSSQPTG